MTLYIVTNRGIVPSLKRTYVDSIEITSNRNNHELVDFVCLRSLISKNMVNI